MKYKMLVCDFDGTLYTDDFKVTKETLDAVEKYKAQGGKFVIATGRLYQAIKPFFLRKPQYALKRVKSRNDTTHLSQMYIYR